MLAPKYVFGYYDIDDITQEGIIIGLKALPKYNEELGTLKTFLFIHINNRLKSFKRDHHFRILKPHCDNVDGSCQKCFQQQQRTNRKKNLMSPLDVEEHYDKFYDTHREYSNLELEELISIIDETLPVSLRMDYLKLKNSVSIPKSRRLEIEAFIERVVEEYNGKEW